MTTQPLTKPEDVRFIELNENVNALRVDDKRYLVFRIGTAAPFLINAICPHRGGPLDHGKYDPQSEAITCPWHGSAFRRCSLERQSLPYIRTGMRITAAVPVAELGSVVTAYSRRCTSVADAGIHDTDTPQRAGGLAR
jgi:nitrite reductase/ring-hydroxylating ferredoxin subunit